MVASEVATGNSYLISLLFSLIIVALFSLLFFFFSCFADYLMLKSADLKPTNASFVPYYRYVKFAQILLDKGKLSHMSYTVIRFLSLFVLPVLNLVSLFYAGYKIVRLPDFINTFNEGITFEETSFFLGILIITFGLLLLNIILSKVITVFLRTSIVAVVFKDFKIGWRVFFCILYGLATLLSQVTVTILTFIFNIILMIRNKKLENISNA